MRRAGCYKITTVFSHAQTVVFCVGCSTVLCQPTGGKARLTEGTHALCMRAHRLGGRRYVPTHRLTPTASALQLPERLDSKTGCFTPRLGHPAE